MIFFITRLKMVSRLSLLLMAILPVIILNFGAFFTSATIRIGVYNNFMNLSTAAEEWEIVEYVDLRQMRQDVANRRLELAYAFHAEGITVYVSPMTLSERVTNLVVASAYLEQVAGEVAARALALHMDADVAELNRRVSEILADGDLMERVVIVHNEAGIEPPMPFRRMFHGLLALFLQLVVMILALGIRSEKEILVKLANISRKKWFLYHLSGVFVIFSLTTIFATISVFLATILFSGVWVLADLLPGFIYVVILSATVYFISQNFQKFYPALIVGSFIFTTLMGGVIFDLREIFYDVGFLRWFFISTYYMEAIGF
ncbi:MAG: hypothetical protein FWG65_08605 [Turicibacter sp.]|nr:hypothetical protein [Turicibacter sp.]